MAWRKIPFSLEMLAFSPETLKILKKGRVASDLTPQKKAGKGKGVDPAPEREGKKEGAEIKKKGNGKGNPTRNRLPYARRQKEHQRGRENAAAVKAADGQEVKGGRQEIQGEKAKGGVLRPPCAQGG